MSKGSRNKKERKSYNSKQLKITTTKKTRKKYPFKTQKQISAQKITRKIQGEETPLKIEERIEKTEDMSC